MALPTRSRAAVTFARGEARVEDLPVPTIGLVDGLLKVEGSGVCGSDVSSFDAAQQIRRVMGHETVGVVAAVGRSAADRWGVAEGDRVILEEYLPCGHCRFCRSAEFRYCIESDPSVNPHALRYGTTGIDVPPALWGGFSEYQYLHERTVMHAVPARLETSLATLALPIANGYEWAYQTGGVRPGGSILIIGPGQQGLGCVLSAAVAGAAVVIVSGLERDADRLEIARGIGATHTLTSTGDQLVESVREATGGEGVDVVVDTATGAVAELVTAIRSVRKGGRIVLPVRRRELLDGVPMNLVSQQALTVVGVRGHSFEAVETAIELIDDRQEQLRPLSTMTAGLDGVAQAILATGGRDGTRAVHATVMPQTQTQTQPAGGPPQPRTEPTEG